MTAPRSLLGSAGSPTRRPRGRVSGMGVGEGPGAGRASGPTMTDTDVRGGGATATRPGGLDDGIVLHQVLQWHHMLTSTDDNPADTVAGLEANTLADGLFHVATWLVLVAGVVVLRKAWASGRPAPRWSAQLGAP